MVHQEMQKLNALNQGARRQFPSHVADVEDSPEHLEEVPSLVADTRAPADKNIHKAPGNYPYPFATNRSKNPPLRPCRNCGSTVHYDRDCDSWCKQGKANARKLPTNAASAAYEEAYIAMLQGDDEACGTHCDTYYAMVDTLTLVESLMVGATMDQEENHSAEDVERNIETLGDDNPVPYLIDTSCRNLEVKVSETEPQTSPRFTVWIECYFMLVLWMDYG